MSYPERPNRHVQLELSGRLDDGGIVEYHDTGVFQEIKLTASQFVLLMVLLIAAKKAGRRRKWGFLTLPELKRHIEFHTGYGPERPALIKQIHRLRKKLASAYSDADDGMRRAHEVLIRHTTLGYRLMVPHKKMTTDLVDADPE